MSQENLSLWNQLATTPPEHCRPSAVTQHDGTRLTLVKSQYRLQKLTEVFGAGNWGWTIHNRWREDWGSVMCAYVELSLWYFNPCDLIPEGTDRIRRKTGHQIGGTIADGNVDNIWKSCITDAIAKCGASIGLCADVYMGEFSDQASSGMAVSYPAPVKMQPGPVFDKPAVKEPEKAPVVKASETAKAQEPVAKPEPKPEPKKEEPKPEPKPEAKKEEAKPVEKAAAPAMRPDCPKCGSTTVSNGKLGKPRHCWDCNADFDNSGNIL